MKQPNKEAVKDYLLQLQDNICQSLEQEDGGQGFIEEISDSKKNIRIKTGVEQIFKPIHEDIPESVISRVYGSPI